MYSASRTKAVVPKPWGPRTGTRRLAVEDTPSTRRSRVGITRPRSASSPSTGLLLRNLISITIIRIIRYIYIYCE